MEKAMRLILATVLIALISTPSMAQMTGKSCSELNGKCGRFCKAIGDSGSCTADCKQAMAVCMSTGNWNTARTNLSGLQKK
jgi:hypothetical protein